MWKSFKHWGNNFYDVNSLHNCTNFSVLTKYTPAYFFHFIKLFFRVNEIATAKLARLVISDKEINAVMVEELSLVLANPHLPERALCQLLSNLTSLLRVWRVHNLNLSEFKIEPHWLICLLCHKGPLSIKWVRFCCGIYTSFFFFFFKRVCLLEKKYINKNSMTTDFMKGLCNDWQKLCMMLKMKIWHSCSWRNLMVIYHLVICPGRFYLT